MIGVFSGIVHVVVSHAPQPGVVLIDEPSDGFYRHGFGQCHDNGFKQQRKTTVGSGPGDFSQVNPTRVALGPGDSGDQISFMQKKSLMPSCFLYCVVGFQIGLPTFRTRKGTSSRKIKADVNTLLLRIKFL